MAVAGPSRLASLAALPLASPTSSASSAAPAAGQASSNRFVHHLLPDAISPSMDLAVVFTTQLPAPASSVAAAAGGPGSAVNLAGMSAAQRLIQQRMAMMRARAAAAAGLATAPSDGSATSGDEPVRGSSIEVSLWRIGSGTDLVWKRSLKNYSSLFDTKGKGQASKLQETLLVAGMQWSPDGRSFATSTLVTRSSIEQSSSSTTESRTVIARHDIKDGSLLSVVPLDAVARPFLSPTLQWVSIDGDAASDRGRVPGTVDNVSAQVPRHMLDLEPLKALAAASAATAGSARFQGLIGGQQSGSSSGPSLTLPSQRGLEVDRDSVAQGKKEEEQDILAGWHCISARGSSENTAMDVLCVPAVDRGGEYVLVLLLTGSVPIMRISLARSDGQESVVVSSLLRSGSLHCLTLGRPNAGDTSADSTSLRYLATSIPSLSSARHRQTLYQILAIGVRLRRHAAHMLDLEYLMSHILGTLKSSVAAKQSSLSAQQLNALPALSRLQYAFSQLSTSHVQSMKQHLLHAVCTGVCSEMIESLLLTSLAAGKWQSIHEGVIRVYEAIEVGASELGRTADWMQRSLKELLGFAEWAERPGSPVPAFMRDSSSQGKSQTEHIRAELAAVGIIRSTAHQILHYAQGERLAWDEFSKWTRWERERIEFMNGEDEGELLTAKTFDPLLITELIQRDFECLELQWLLLKVKRAKQHGFSGGIDGAAGDETEESFVRPGAGEDSANQAPEESAAAQDASMSGSAAAVDDILVSDGTSKGPTTLASRMQETVSWLDAQETQDRTTPPDSDTMISAGAAERLSDEPRLFQPGSATALCDRKPSTYAKHVLRSQIRELALSVKEIFTRLPEKIELAPESTLEIRLPLPSEADHRNAEPTLDLISSLSSSSPSLISQLSSLTPEEVRDSLWTEHTTRSRIVSNASSGESSLASVIIALDRQSFLLSFIPCRTAGSVDLKASQQRICWLALSNIARAEIFDDDRLLVLHDGDSTGDGAVLDCFSMRSLIECHSSVVHGPSPSTPLEATLLYRQPVGTVSSSERGRSSHNLAFSVGRNIVGLLRRKGSAESSSNGQQVSSSWTEQTADFWDLQGEEAEGMGGDEDEDEDARMAEA